MLRAGSALALTLALTVSLPAAEPVVVKLWPDKAPGETKDLGFGREVEPKKGQAEVKRLTDVGTPTMTIYPPAADKANGTAVIVAPGGGYSILAYEHEGTDVCEYLSKLGVTAVLLKYRVPKRPMQMPDNLAAFQDAQRAVCLLRKGAKENGIDPARIGMLGFSAGGNLTACAAFAEKRMYDEVDAADKESPVPNFALLVYPAYLSDKGGGLKPEYKVTKDAPPMFFAHSSDDPISSEGSVALYQALKKNNVPAELHLYASGGHGYGMRKTPHPCATWPDRAADWLKARGLLEKAKPKE
ncbi:xylanase : Exported endo-1,4-beta-xylanase OS=Pirellula staleyi (strain ATCC 27377 / DSM 6068 / ICPB 4128) GN=Psta_3524 PE=4 SV=1: Abhydrolase_3 [Gemmataceae bacterium]|nr:xylanase : Exported endo-1,4-beta-xylanase OS=Pirellula staleyi (strain ATCC 27377 / DSM 6068 / ICPB 4128) GN=Psta_3524 PE=4 SV=1: Abhydrolase_3 [Gemmataceae bacterium]VTU02042.1 xylanase : Exported endo-1,4-beta-xylanase OS=Pirellula staleyi (strain ATCC 27377 / DSM 6068 / ICPB 4128) GN=Psta_3524 PE=4 SV=1: Abhydrolase_3 [Gemmataceae bacterium]